MCWFIYARDGALCTCSDAIASTCIVARPVRYYLLNRIIHNKVVPRRVCRHVLKPCCNTCVVCYRVYDLNVLSTIMLNHTNHPNLWLMNL